MDLTNRSACAFRFGDRGGNVTQSTEALELRSEERIAIVDQEALAV